MATATRWDELETDPLAEYDWDAEEGEAVDTAAGIPAAFGIQPLSTPINDDVLDGLALRAKAGDQRAAATVTRALAPLVFAELAKMPGLDDADTYAWGAVGTALNAWEAKGRFAAFAAVVVGRALKTALTAQNAQKRTAQREAASLDALREAGYEPTASGSLEAAVLGAEVSDAILDAVAELPAVERQAIEWLELGYPVPGWEGGRVTYEAVAPHLGVGRSGVQKIRARALTTLREALGDRREELLGA